MDIKCNHCGEPWDSYHLKFEVPHELTPVTQDDWRLFGTFEEVSEMIRGTPWLAGWATSENLDVSKYFHVKKGIHPECRYPAELWDIWMLIEEKIKASIKVMARNGVYPSYLKPFLRRAGWEFGSSMLDVRMCTCCKDSPIRFRELTREQRDVFDLQGLTANALQYFGVIPLAKEHGLVPVERLVNGREPAISVGTTIDGGDLLLVHLACSESRMVVSTSHGRAVMPLNTPDTHDIPLAPEAKVRLHDFLAATGNIMAKAFASRFSREKLQKRNEPTKAQIAAELMPGDLDGQQALLEDLP